MEKLYRGTLQLHKSTTLMHVYGNGTIRAHYIPKRLFEAFGEEPPLELRMTLEMADAPPVQTTRKPKKMVRKVKHAKSSG